MSQADYTFISYSRADGAFALKLARDLRAAGVNIWLDQLDITPGERWDREVEQGLKNCRRLLIILSTASSQSENVQDEIGYAMQQKKLIIPVLYQPCDIPFRLLRLQYLDFTRGYQQGLQRLLPVMKGTDAEVARVTGSFKMPDFNQPPVTQPLITSNEPVPKAASSFRKGVAIGGGTVALLLLLLVVWAANTEDDPTPPISSTPIASIAAASVQPTLANNLTASPQPTVTAKPAETPAPTIAPQPAETPLPPISNIAPRGRVEVSSVSTQADSCQTGERAVDSVVGGYPRLNQVCNEWATDGSTGAWIKLSFNRPAQITQIILYDRINLYDQILSGTLEFSDGSRQKVDALRDGGAAKVITIEPAKSKIAWVKFTIDQAKGSNTGLAEIEVWGWLANP